MTNYNERLDEILCDALNGEGVYRGYSGKVKAAGQDEAKQAITSLIKELVAEARIDELKLLADFQMGDITVMGRNERSWRDRISELEQNILKALEEKK